MNHIKEIETRAPVFHAWLSARGAQVLEPTSVWEVCRFKTNVGTSIIYKNKTGRLRFTGEALIAWTAFTSGGSWRAAPATKRKLKSAPMCRSLRERDGDMCFYCQKIVEIEDESIEHLVAITHGGPDHIANMVLAHRAPCNAEAGHLSVMDKILRREKLMRTAKSEEILDPPWEVA